MNFYWLSSFCTLVPLQNFSCVGCNFTFRAKSDMAGLFKYSRRGTIKSWSFRWLVTLGSADSELELTFFHSAMKDWDAYRLMLHLLNHMQVAACHWPSLFFLTHATSIAPCHTCIQAT